MAETQRPQTPSARLALALRLHDEGVELMRQNLRRRHPDEGEDAIERRLQVWLGERPGAPHGDAVGRRRGPRA